LVAPPAPCSPAQLLAAGWEPAEIFLVLGLAALPAALTIILMRVFANRQPNLAVTSIEAATAEQLP
jgi:hypothetical protein